MTASPDAHFGEKNMKFRHVAFLFGALSLSMSAVCAQQSDARWRLRAEQPGLTPFQKKAYAQMALLCFQRDVYHSAPVQTLGRMGLNVLPILAEGLSDSTPTRTIYEPFSVDRGGPHYIRPRVNEVAAQLAVRVASHDFAVGEFPGQYSIRSIDRFPTLTPQFQKFILRWYAANRNKTLARRKMEDLGDHFLRNRLDAVEWLGKNRTTGGKAALVRFIDTILARKSNDTSSDTELAQSALALGQIGDRTARPAVQRVCRHFIDYAQGPNGLPRYFLDYIAPDKLFAACHGLALLGEKPKALKTLREVDARYGAQMRKSERRNFNRNLKSAARW